MTVRHKYYVIACNAGGKWEGCCNNPQRAWLAGYNAALSAALGVVCALLAINWLNGKSVL